MVLPPPPLTPLCKGKRARRRFGPLFYVTAAIALVVAGSRPFWQTASEQYTAWRLTRQLHDPRKAIREHAALELARLGPAATSWVIRATRDREPVVRGRACSIVVQTMPERPDDGLAALLAAAKDNDPAVRQSAVMQLERMIGKFGSSAESVVGNRAIRALGAAVSDDSRNVRLQAISGLLAVGPRARPVVGALDRALDEPDKAIRIWAADALLRVDADSTRARVIAAMSPMLRDLRMRLEHFNVVEILTRAQGAEATAAMLVPLLKDADRETRMTAITDLTTHCAGVQAVRPAMIEGATERTTWSPFAESPGGLLSGERKPDMASPMRSTRWLEKVRSPGRGQLLWSEPWLPGSGLASSSSIKLLTPKLLDRLGQSTKPGNRAFVIAALGEIGPVATTGVPALLELSNGTDLDVAVQAIAALAKIEPRTAATKIPALLEWATVGGDRRVRLSAIVALRDFGPAAASAVPRHWNLLADEQEPTHSQRSCDRSHIKNRSAYRANAGASPCQR